MQQSNKKKEQCTTMGCAWVFTKQCLSKAAARGFKGKYKADLKRRWQKEVELEMLDRENWVTQDAQ
jgi:hypothetical protein